MSSPQLTSIIQSNTPSTHSQDQTQKQNQKPELNTSTSLITITSQSPPTPKTTAPSPPTFNLNLQDLTFRHPRLPTITLTNSRRPLPQSQTFLAGRHSCLKASATTEPGAKEMVEMGEKRGGGDDPESDDGGMGEAEEEKEMEMEMEGKGCKKPFVTRGGKIFVNVQK